MSTKALLALTALMIAAPPALARQAEPLVLDGLYLFMTDALQDGQPVCSEAWTFGPDGEMSVESGQERVRKRYRTESDRDGQWIVTETLETNGAADCMGHESDAVTPGEHRTYVVPMNSGIILTCPPPSHTPDGAPYISNCYGRIVLASEAG
ncbi:MAG: hypothetical protein ACOH1E_10120 [Brevundimonas sp.]